jgi:site-specific DNA-methyltransferase (adenine-specific)
LDYSIDIISNLISAGGSQTMFIQDDVDNCTPFKKGVIDLRIGNCREVLGALPEDSIDCCITSPPYFNLRDYDHPDQIGDEETPEAFVAALVEVFRDVHRVLKDDGTLWINLGDSYARVGSNGAQGNSAKVGNTRTGVQRRNCVPPPGFKNKDLFGIPWRVALALQADGWFLRSDIIWHKTNAMPESVTDRPTKGHEYMFLLTKKERYFYDAEAVKEPHAIEGMRNRRSVWNIPTRPFRQAHFATMPPTLAETCVLAGTSEKGHCPNCGKRWRRGGTSWVAGCRCGREPVPDRVLDPFGGAGTTALAAAQLGRDAITIELNPEYAAIARDRLALSETTDPESDDENEAIPDRPGPLPEPPDDLSPAEADVWRSHVGALGIEPKEDTVFAFDDETSALLAAYCRHIASADELAKQLNVWGLA